MGVTDLTTLLVVALAIASIVVMLRKRYDSNLPLLFYAVAVVFTNVTDRETSPYLLYAGLVFALLLRFEFMSHGFAKFVAFLATSSTCLIVWVLLAEVFGANPLPF
jgi:hypothetical protein